MAHLAGDRLGPYEITAPLGAGGMGEVYKARDTRLDRTVAIKVLPDHIAKRTDLLARFEREARAVASLNHPNICTLYDIGPGYMVMELIEGETLAARIEKGPIPLDQALPFALQIADALDRAHRAGVTHRDVKPPNIMLTRDGVKVLDFGLAKSQAKPGPTEETLTAVLTTEGTVMGTPQYMAPEQFAGKEADARSDIWAFGAVLYEMVTGRKAFVGSNYQSLVGAILATEPAPMTVKPFTPAWLERMVRRCLAKDPDDRWQSMRDIVLELRTPPVEAAAAEPAKAARWPWIAAAAAVLLTAAGAWLLRPGPPPRETLRFRISSSDGHRHDSAAISPDGRLVVTSVAASGKSQLWLQGLDELEAHPIPFTEGGEYPFWSPDGRNIGFFANGKLKKVAVSGGPAQSLCDAPDPRGGSWSRENLIVFAPSIRSGLQRVPAAGGAPADMNVLGAGGRWPTFLPDGRRFLYMSAVGGDTGGLYIGSLDGNDNRRLLADRSPARFAPGAGGDHILFLRENILMALPFEASSAQPVGEAFPVAEHGVTDGISILRASVSANGVLLYQRRIGALNQLTWFDRAGKALRTVGERGPIREPALSPDEKKVAFVRSSAEEGSADVWLRDLDRGTETRLTTDVRRPHGPVWSPAGDRIAFGSDSAGQSGLHQKASNGGGSDELLHAGDASKTLTQWSRDGKFAVYSLREFPNSLWVFPMDAAAAGRKPITYLKTAHSNSFGQISPDGNWMAYSSTKTGRAEVYVRPFPSGDGEWTISVAGGLAPRWRADGKELFFLDNDRTLLAVPVKAAHSPKPVFEAGTPAVLFKTNLAATSSTSRPLYQYDVTADGKRFLIAAFAEAARDEAPYIVITNWQASVKK